VRGGWQVRQGCRSLAAHQADQAPGSIGSQDVCPSVTCLLHQGAVVVRVVGPGPAILPQVLLTYQATQVLIHHTLRACVPHEIEMLQSRAYVRLFIADTTGMWPLPLVGCGAALQAAHDSAASEPACWAPAWVQLQHQVPVIGLPGPTLDPPAHLSQTSPGSALLTCAPSHSCCCWETHHLPPLAVAHAAAPTDYEAVLVRDQPSSHMRQVLPSTGVAPGGERPGRHVPHPAVSHQCAPAGRPAASMAARHSSASSTKQMGAVLEICLCCTAITGVPPCQRSLPPQLHHHTHGKRCLQCRMLVVVVGVMVWAAAWVMPSWANQACQDQAVLCCYVRR
jgi:hypothetical protein